MTTATTTKQVEKDIRSAGVAAKHIAEEAIGEYALWFKARKNHADVETINWYYGRYQGKASALGWVLGYETEEEYTDMHSVMHDYLQTRGKERARRYMDEEAA